MTFSIVIGIAAVLFGAGIVFIMKAVSSKESEAIPISNPKEIEELKNAFLPPEKKEGVASEPGASIIQPKIKQLFPKSKKQVEIDQWMET